MTNAQHAFDNYLMWISNYPGDYQGATEAASDFIDTEDDLNGLETLLAEAAGIDC